MHDPENDDSKTPPDDAQEDLYAVFLRVAGWVYAAVGATMLAFFLWWLRG